MKTQLVILLFVFLQCDLAFANDNGKANAGAKGRQRQQQIHRQKQRARQTPPTPSRHVGFPQRLITSSKARQRTTPPPPSLRSLSSTSKRNPWQSSFAPPNKAVSKSPRSKLHGSAKTSALLSKSTAPKNQNPKTSWNSTTAVVKYDPASAARVLLQNGTISVSNLRKLVPNDKTNSFSPTRNIRQGEKYVFKLNGKRLEIRWHSPDAKARQKHPEGHSGRQWTAQIKIGKKWLGADGKLHNKHDNNVTHIPLAL